MNFLASRFSLICIVLLWGFVNEAMSQPYGDREAPGPAPQPTSEAPQTERPNESRSAASDSCSNASSLAYPCLGFDRFETDAPNNRVYVNGTIKITAFAHDLDGSVPDTLYYHWKVADNAGTLVPSGAGSTSNLTTWTAPSTPGKHKIYLTVNDTQYDGYDNNDCTSGDGGACSNIIGGHYAPGDTRGDPADNKLNDPPVKDKWIEITVMPGKAWNVGKPIGQDENGKTNGRLTAPYDTRTAGYLVQTAYAVPGASIPFAIDAATDWDGYRDEAGANRQSQDTLTDADYVWSATGGATFEVREDQNGQTIVTQSGTTVTGRQAWLLLPATAQSADTFSVKCTVSNTHGLPVVEPDTPAPNGRRDTTPLVRTQDVTIAPSALALDVFKRTGVETSRDAATYVSVGTNPIGGKVFVALYLTIGRGQKVASSAAWVRLFEKPDTANGVTHSGAENHVDVKLDFTQAGAWQRKFDPDGGGANKNSGWWPADVAPSAAPSAAGEVRYRTLVLWETAKVRDGSRFTIAGAEALAGKLLGHNGAHQISVLAVDDNLVAPKVKFTSAYGGSLKVNVPAALEKNVSNLVITKVEAGDGNPNYLKFDSGSNNPTIQHPTLSFTFEDGDFRPGDRYQWDTFFFETNGETGYDRMGSLTALSVAPVPVILPTMPPGVYSFELSIDKIRNGTIIDSQIWRSNAVHFDRTDLVNSNGQLKFHYGITPWGLTEAHTLSDLQIYALNGDWTEGLHTSGTMTLNPAPVPDHVVNAPATTNDEPGEGRVIATGIDDEATRYRDHKKKRLWPLNHPGPLNYRMYVANGPEIGGEIDASGTLSMSDPLIITTPKGEAATIYSLPLDTNRTPDKIWQELANFKPRRGVGNTKYHSVIVNTHGHSNLSIHMISQVSGGGHFSEYSFQNDTAPIGHPAWTIGRGIIVGTQFLVGKPQHPYTVTHADYNLKANTSPNLTGVTFFNMMGCRTSGTSIGSHVATTTSDIAQVVSAQKKADNSMGYSALVIFTNTPSRVPGQIWFDALYDKGNFAISSTQGSAYQAEDIYIGELSKLGIKNGCTVIGSTPNYGWDKWVVTNNKPILDR